MRTFLLFFSLLTCAHIARSQTPNTLSPTTAISFTVSPDGSGTHKTIQEAVNSFRDHMQVQVTVYVKNGTYPEKLVIPSWKPTVRIVGESREGVVITGDDYAGKPYPGGRDRTGTDKFSTYTSYTVLVEAPDVVLENLTIRNTAGRVGQAVALHVEADRFVCRNCRLLGNQDTLYAAAEGSRQYYADCYIEGTTDFIFGKSVAVFQSCTIRSLADSYITAAATPAYQRYGFVFFDCTLIADPAAKKVYLGRPWRPYAKTVFIRTRMDEHIVPAGWDNWNNAANEQTVFYAEAGSTGAGAAGAKRVGWANVLAPKDVRTYTLANLFAAPAAWLPTAAK